MKEELVDFQMPIEVLLPLEFASQVPRTDLSKKSKKNFFQIDHQPNCKRRWQQMNNANIGKGQS